MAFKAPMLLFILFSMSSAAIGESKPLRQDCISRMEINWADTPDIDKEKIIHEVVRVIIHAPKKKYNLISPSLAVRGNHREFVYLQYSFDCGSKYENTLDLVRQIKDYIDIEITVSGEIFPPGVETIRVSGPSWADKEEQVGKRVTIDGKPYIKVE